MTTKYSHTLTRKAIKASGILAVAGLLALSAGSALALHFEPNDGFTVDVDTTLTYGAMWRMEDRGEVIRPLRPVQYWPGGGLTNDSNDFYNAALKWNSDDGDRNFKKGDLVSNRVSAITDMDFRYNNKGAFLRTQIFYDNVYFEHNSWTGKGFSEWGHPYPASGVPNCVPVPIALVNCGAYLGPSSINNLVADGEIHDPREFSKHAKNTMGYKARFLDAYVYGNFEIGEHTLDLRIGRQAISWGESLMLQGGIGFAQNRINAIAATSPGVELKEIFLPTGAVYGQLDLTSSLTMEAYWQYEWLPSELMADGSYFSTQDMLDSNVMLTNAGVRNVCMYGSASHTTNTTGILRRCSDGLITYVDPMYGPTFTTKTGLTEATGTLAIPIPWGDELFSDQMSAMFRAQDKVPDHPGDQGGVAFRYLLENGSEAGVYALQYHDHYPSLWAGNNGAKLYANTAWSQASLSGPTLEDWRNTPGMNMYHYTVEYKENLKLVGLTYNTVINDIQTAFELAYRPNQPIVPACTQGQLENDTHTAENGTPLVNPITGGQAGPALGGIHTTCRDPSFLYWIQRDGLYNTSLPDSAQNLADKKFATTKLLHWPVEAPIYTYNVGITAVVPPTPFWDTGIFVGEVGGWYIPSWDNQDLFVTTGIGGFTKTGYGTSFIFLPQYKNVAEGVDLTVPIFVNYTLNGSMAYFNYSEKSSWVALGLEAIYLSNTTFGITYNIYGGSNNMWQDRDNVSVNVKYTF